MSDLRASIPTEQIHVIENEDPTSERFATAAVTALKAGALFALSRKLPPAQARRLRAGQMRDSALQDRIEDLAQRAVLDLDNSTGQYGQRGMAWLEAKADELADRILGEHRTALLG